MEWFAYAFFAFLGYVAAVCALGLALFVVLFICFYIQIARENRRKKQ
jgi:cell division protein FtsX